MASINKRKILESAQRHLQKGALDRALKDYQTVLDADPRDTNVRLKVGDLLQKSGRNDDAIAAYLKVADQFQRDGFDAKAVALYKQVTKIDDKRHDVYVPLADLYQRLGMMSEAMGSLQTAADAFRREGRKREALDLLRRMASLDPANVTSRLKVAELLHQEGLEVEALAEFREAAAEFDRQGDWEARAGVLERIVELRPECVEELEALGATWLERGQPRRAHQFAQKLVEADPGRPESKELLARVLSELGQEELAIDAFRECAEAWRVRGDEGRAREVMQRYLPPQDFASLTNGETGPVQAAGNGAAPETLFGDAGELGAEPADGEGVFGSEPLEAPGGGAVELGGDDLGFDPAAIGGLDPGRAPAMETAPPAPPAAAAEPASAPEPEGDVDQLLAEAAVYLRYGKHERALASLEAALAQEPEHPDVLEQLGQVHAAAGAPARAVEAWVRAAALASTACDAERFAALRDRVASLDPAAAEGLVAPVPADVPEPAPGAADAAADALADEDLDDIEIDVDDADFSAADLEAGEDADELDEPRVEAPASDLGDEGAAAAEVGIEIELDAPEPSGLAPEPAAADVEPTPESVDCAAEAGSGDDETDPSEGLELDDSLDPDAGVASALDTEALPASSEEDLEAGPEPVEASAAEETPASDDAAWELSFEEDEEPEALATDAGDAPSAPAESSPLAAPSPVGSAGELSMGSAQQIQEDFEEASFYFEQGLLPEAEAIYRRILERAPSHPGALLRLGEISVQRGGAPGVAGELLEAAASRGPERIEALDAVAPPSEEAPEIEPPDALDLTAPTLDDAEAADWGGAMAEAPDGEDSTANVIAPPEPAVAEDTTLQPTAVRVGSADRAPADEPELTTPDMAQEENPAGAAFDLAAELSEALAETPPAAGATTDEDGFASLFREFKRGVSQTLGEGDIETHFDLGIAYREMGLFEDAIGEFRYALGSPSRRLDALQLMGLCALDLGRGQDAVGHLEQALASPNVPAEREAPLRYELGRAYQALPDRGRALDAFRRVAELEPGFQDVAERLAALENDADEPLTAPAAEEPAEAFESFDDLVAEAAQDAPAAAERFETFADVVAEANDDEDAEADEAGEAEWESAEDAPAPEGEAARLDAETEAAFAEAAARDDDTSSCETAEPDASEPEPQPAEPATPAPRRRRKVSFV